jgi:uncharacterized protein with ParB-like and HNH nuclease domain
MQFQQRTILGLFDSSQKSFVIPVYQRAYSWEKDQWDTLLNDLREQIRGNNNYFFGNLLLETLKKDVLYEVIDGQQRLTTLTIFIRSILDIFKSRIQKGEQIELDIDDKEKIYLKNKGNIKLRPASYDQACFDTLIIDGKKKYEANTPSQKKIAAAKKYFTKELAKEKTADLMKILDKLETTELTTIELSGKKDSALMFELQNNRGKDLTNMEKLKSYFMYQMYVYSDPEITESNIEYISNIFKQIYIIINDLKDLNEDSVLIYHCNAYVKGYNYRTIEDIKDVFREETDKVGWIKKFSNELHTSFSNMKKLERSNDKNLTNLRTLTIPVFVYPFFIKGYKYFGDQKDSLSSLFHLMEILAFRFHLINSRADIRSRLNEVLEDFTGDLSKLQLHLKDKLNESWYWGDERIEMYLDDWMYGNKVLTYLLWRYEDAIQGKGYSIGNGSIENEQIEHISPQTPTEENEEIECGYDVNEDNEYDEEFQKEYLNCIGNLMLISGSHNASIGNQPFENKLASYHANPLLKQQAEIKTFLEEGRTVWDKDAIDRRHIKIVDGFALNEWSFDKVKVKS